MSSSWLLFFVLAIQPALTLFIVLLGFFDYNTAIGSGFRVTLRLNTASAIVKAYVEAFVGFEGLINKNEEFLQHSRENDNWATRLVSNGYNVTDFGIAGTVQRAKGHDFA
ncbi:hypothetical protein MMC21_008302 [Puttea exsequens]|nr:hypothetical protein [Puttea exsequens]